LIEWHRKASLFWQKKRFALSCENNNNDIERHHRIIDRSSAGQQQGSVVSKSIFALIIGSIIITIASIDSHAPTNPFTFHTVRRNHHVGVIYMVVLNTFELILS
jgi:hypothetical protein